jgi:hypothetical protein
LNCIFFSDVVPYESLFKFKLKSYMRYGLKAVNTGRRI